MAFNEISYGYLCSDAIDCKKISLKRLALKALWRNHVHRDSNLITTQVWLCKY